MAKENEKKVSENMSSEELENVAGGFCISDGKSVPKGVQEVKQTDLQGGYYMISLIYKDGHKTDITFNPDGSVYNAGNVYNRF